MAEVLNSLRAAKGSIEKRFKKGRGIPSGSGKTCGRGHRGQKCRSGYARTPWKEGGQTPLYRRLPKYQTNTRVNRKEFTLVNLYDLQNMADTGYTEVSLETLVDAGRIKSIEKWGLKILAHGEVKAKLTVKAERFSETAKAAIEAAGGTCEIISN